jgi:hypothetical protein
MHSSNTAVEYSQRLSQSVSDSEVDSESGLGMQDIPRQILHAKYALHDDADAEVRHTDTNGSDAGSDLQLHAAPQLRADMLHLSEKQVRMCA